MKLVGLQALPISESRLVPVKKRRGEMAASKNYGPPPVGPGSDRQISPHGQAALILAESILHSLLKKGLLSREDFIEIVEGAAEVECELALAEASSPTDLNGSLLYPLSAAFRRELGW